MVALILILCAFLLSAGLRAPVPGLTRLFGAAGAGERNSRGLIRVTRARKVGVLGRSQTTAGFL